MSEQISIHKGILVAEINPNKIMLTRIDHDEVFYELVDCDARVVALLIKKAPLTRSNFKQQLVEKFDLHGMPVDEYLEKLLVALHERGIVASIG